MAFTFAEMTEDDLPQLHRWFEQAHVREFYDREPRTLEGVAAQYRAKLLGEEPARPFIASLAGTAIGYLQAYRIADYPDYARAIDVEPDTAGVDMLIGELAYAHRGLGAVLLRQFVDEVVWDLTGATVCWIGPSIHNAIAIRCYAKAGFVHVKTVHVPGEDRPDYLMRLERQRSSG
jgi:RimJ/RimL family protein N-acetyltransferase